MSNLLKRINNTSGKLGSLQAGSPKFYLLLLPPVYMFWSINLISITFTKGKVIMTYIAILMSLISLLLIGIYGYGLLLQLSFIKTAEFKAIIAYFTITWCLFYFIISFRSLRFEIKNNISNPNIIEYFVRFFVLTNWYIGVWSFQTILNQYKEISN